MSSKRSEERFVELDAVRGLAAMVVVLRHFINASTAHNLVLRLLYRFNLFIAAKEAVLLFFLLSGFVLSLPFARGKVHYPAFLVKRICRIYAPYLAALALAVCGASFLHGHMGGLSYWTELTWSKPVSAKLVWQHVLFLGNYEWPQFNTAFWSLVYEMRISLIFPLLFVAVRKLRTGALGIAAILSIVACRATTHQNSIYTAHYAAIFIVGAVLATNLPAMRNALNRMNRWYRGTGTLVAICLIMRGEALPVLRNYSPLNDWPVVLGACWIVLLAISEGRFHNFLRGDVPQFLGRISYSLYLVHGTVLFALLHLLYGRVGLVAIFPVYLVAAFCLATLFHLSVEVPSMNLGHQLASKLKQRYQGSAVAVASAGD